MTPEIVLQALHSGTPTYKYAHTDTHTCTKIKIKRELVLCEHFKVVKKKKKKSPAILQERSDREALRIQEDEKEPIWA